MRINYYAKEINLLQSQIQYFICDHKKKKTTTTKAKLENVFSI